jgi:hypothetical protein
MTTAGRPGAIRHAEAPALAEEDLVEAVVDFTAVVAVADPMAAVAGIDNRSFSMFPPAREI